ncbi:hypothetical protein CR513_00084, partial [Mucuna pruriens]
MAEMFSRLLNLCGGPDPLRVSRKGRRKEALANLWSTDHTEGQALKRRTGTSGINVFQFLALHRPSNGPWTKRPLPERTMSRGPPPPPQDTRNWKDKQTHPVDCRATSPTTQERDSLKSQGRGWPRGPTWRLGISAGNAKAYIIIGNTLTLGTGAWPKSRVALRSRRSLSCALFTKIFELALTEKHGLPNFQASTGSEIEILLPLAAENKDPTFGPSEAEKETPKHPRCEKKKGPFSKPFEVDRDKDKRLATELDALNRTHGAVISDAAKKEERLAVKAIPVKDRLFPNTVFLQKPENPIRINLKAFRKSKGENSSLSTNERVEIRKERRPTGYSAKQTSGREFDFIVTQSSPYLPMMIFVDRIRRRYGKMTSQQDINALSQPISEDSIFPFRKAPGPDRKALS